MSPLPHTMTAVGAVIQDVAGMVLTVGAIVAYWRNRLPRGTFEARAVYGALMMAGVAAVLYFAAKVIP